MFIALIGAAVALMTAQSGNESVIFNLTKGGQEYVCADLNQASANEAMIANNWIMGYWSGLNVAFSMSHTARGDVGDTITPRGLLGEVKLRCEQNPSDNLPVAVKATYLRLRNAGK